MATVKLKYRPSTVSGKEGTLYFQIIHDRVVRQLATGYRIFDDEWNSAKSMIVCGNDATRNQILAGIRDSIRWDIERLNRIINDFDKCGYSYTPDEVIAELQRISQEHTLFNFAQSVVTQLQYQVTARTGETYKTTLNSFKRFRNGEDIMLDAITSTVLKNYQAWLIGTGCTRNTVSFYMRKLRALYNRAVDDEIIADKRPFRHVFTGIEKTQKRAIPCDEISKIRKVDLTKMPKMKFARDMFLLSFYLRGMSYVDMTFLRKSDLSNGTVTYRRHKTNQLITIKWTDKMQQIVDNYPANDSQFLLPIIVSDSCDLRKAYVNIGQRINYHLKKLGKLLNISTNLTMYCSRHSWATIARDKGIALSVISEGLGHDNERTTQIYLASLSPSKVDKANDIVSSAI
jgi:site-specific recombinase XerD